MGAYAARWLAALLVLELLTRTLHFNALAKHGLLTRGLLAAWGVRVQPLHFAVTGFWVLVFMWLKVSCCSCRQDFTDVLPAWREQLCAHSVCGDRPTVCASHALHAPTTSTTTAVPGHLALLPAGGAGRRVRAAREHAAVRLQQL